MQQRTNQGHPREALPGHDLRAARAILGAALLLSIPGVARATLTGPMVGCQQASQLVQHNATTFFLPSGEQYPIPPELLPASGFTYLRVPGTAILVSQRGGDPQCTGSLGDGHILYVHDFPASSGSPLIPRRTNVCIPEQVAQAGHCVYDRPATLSPQRVVAVRERTASTAVVQRTLWMHLDLTAPDSWSSQLSPIQLTTYSPSGDAAVIQHDLNDGIGDPDWAVIDLCPGSVGTVLANVTDLQSPVTPEVVLKPDGSFVVRLTHGSGVAEVGLPDCLGPPPPPPPTHARLTTTALGPGNGVIQDTPALIQCATDGNPNRCQADYPIGTEVTLFAIGRDPGAVFQSWSGDCTGSGFSTSVILAADRSCTASFDEVRAELEVVVATVPEPVVAGGVLTATATVSNTGPDPAVAAQLTLNPPSGITVDLAQLPAGCSQLPNLDIRCTLGTLAPGSAVAPAIVMDVDPFTRGMQPITATVSTTTWESNLADNTDVATSTVTSSTDLAILKRAFPEPVTRGSLLAYRLEVTNLGPSASVGATVTDSLPFFVTLLSSPGTTSPTFFMGPLAPGLTAIGTVLVGVDPTTPVGTTLTNTADVAAADPDPVTVNDVASVASTVASNLVGNGPLGPITLVADTSTSVPSGSGTFDGFDVLPAIDGDTVAFSALVDAGSRRGIYRSVGGLLIEVAREGSTTPAGRAGFSELDPAGLSASGYDAAFVGAFPLAGGGFSNGLYRTGPCFLEPVADPDTATQFVGVFGGEIQGPEAVLLASTAEPFHGIVHTDGQALTVVYERTITPQGDAEQLGVPSWDGTTVAFWRALPSVGEEGILAWRDGSVSVVADRNTPVPGGVGTFTIFEREVSVDGDLVAFQAQDGNGDPGVYVVDLVTGVTQTVAGPQTVIPGTTSTFALFPSRSGPSVSAGRVAFVGSDATVVEGGLFLWGDGVLQTVVHNLHPLPPNGVAFPLIGNRALSGDRVVFGNGSGIWVAEVSGGGGAIFADGFESGDTTAWSTP